MLKVGFGADHSKPMQLWNLSTKNENKQITIVGTSEDRHDSRLQAIMMMD